MKGIVIAMLVLSSPLCTTNIPEIVNTSEVGFLYSMQAYKLKACFLSTADIENN